MAQSSTTEVHTLGKLFIIIISFHTSAFNHIDLRVYLTHKCTTATHPKLIIRLLSFHIAESNQKVFVLTERQITSIMHTDY